MQGEIKHGVRIETQPATLKVNAGMAVQFYRINGCPKMETTFFIQSWKKGIFHLLHRGRMQPSDASLAFSAESTSRNAFGEFLQQRLALRVTANRVV